MSRVTVEPASLTFEVGPGEDILTAALRAGIRWPTVCKGGGTCKTCYLLIRSGAEHFSPLTPREQQELAWVRRRHQDVPERHVRLACQANVGGDVTVFCKGARPAAAQVPASEGPSANSVVG